MAIAKELYGIREDGIKLYRTYSDNNYKLKKVGTEEIYDEAIDVENATYEYEETIEPIEMSEIEEKALAYEILVGEV